MIFECNGEMGHLKVASHFHDNIVKDKKAIDQNNVHDAPRLAVFLM